MRGKRFMSAVEATSTTITTAITTATTSTSSAATTSTSSASSSRVERIIEGFAERVKVPTSLLFTRRPSEESAAVRVGVEVGVFVLHLRLLMRRQLLLHLVLFLLPKASGVRRE